MPRISLLFVDDRNYPALTPAAKNPVPHSRCQYSVRGPKFVESAETLLDLITIGRVGTLEDIDKALAELAASNFGDEVTADYEDEKNIDLRLCVVYNLKLLQYAHQRGFLVMGIDISYMPTHELSLLLLKHHQVRSVLPLRNRPDGRDLVKDVLSITPGKTCHLERLHLPLSA